MCHLIIKYLHNILIQRLIASYYLFCFGDLLRPDLLRDTSWPIPEIQSFLTSNQHLTNMSKAQSSTLRNFFVLSSSYNLTFQYFILPVILADSFWKLSVTWKTSILAEWRSKPWNFIDILSQQILYIWSDWLQWPLVPYRWSHGCLLLFSRL